MHPGQHLPHARGLGEAQEKMMEVLGRANFADLAKAERRSELLTISA